MGQGQTIRRMKLRHAAALALLILASCGPDMATINSATERAERAAQRAEAAGSKAERAAELASAAANRTKSADFIEYKGGGAAFSEGSAKWWAMRAQDVETRFEVGASCSHGIADVPGHPYPCQPLSPEDWKRIDAKAGELDKLHNVKETAPPISSRLIPPN